MNPNRRSTSATDRATESRYDPLRVAAGARINMVA